MRTRTDSSLGQGLQAGRLAAYLSAMSHDPRYLEFFERFNRGEYFAAHEVLEALWLPARRGPNAAFYQGLIQLAGAFVHLQKHRPAPAARLLARARELLKGYPARHEELDLVRVRTLIATWLARLETGTADAPLLRPETQPTLRLFKPTAPGAG